MNVRGNALQAGGTCWCRSRRQLVNLDKLWGPRIGGRAPTDPVERARGILHMFSRIAHFIQHPRVNIVDAWTPACDWCSRPHRQRDLAASLLLEKAAIGFEERTRHALSLPIAGNIQKPRQPTAPFFLILNRAYRLDIGKRIVMNQLLRIVPHHGLALLILLVEKGLIEEALKKKLRREHARRHLSGDTNVRVFELVPDAGTQEKLRVFYATISVLFSMDDDMLWAQSRAAEFVEFV